MTTGRTCEQCGEQLGGRYQHNGQLVRWPCTGLALLPSPPPSDPEWIRFRKTIIDALWAIDPRRFVYINENRVLGVPRLP